MARYAERIGELSQVLDVLGYHPEGLAISDVAAEVGTSEAELRETLLAYYAADLGQHLPHVVRPDVIELFGGPDEDPRHAVMVRVIPDRPTHELGMDLLSVEELALLYRSGRQLLFIEPDNQTLAAALERLRSTLLPVQPELVLTPKPPPALYRAIVDRRRLRVRYARAWAPGIVERDIEPYRLVRSFRGWELDAGPVRDDGDIRTYLVAGLHSVEELGSGFEVPDDLDGLIARHRVTTTVELVVPHWARWAVTRQADSVLAVEEDEDRARLLATFLPPVDKRVALVLLAARPLGHVVSPGDLADAGQDLARTMLAQYSR